MSQAQRFLAFPLEGPLQSWGERARWTVRDTAPEPTKSGIVGLLAACLGWGAAQDAEIARLAGELRLGVRIDRPGRALVDYHTVGGGRPPIGVMSAGGVIKINATTKEPETVVSRRTYLADASFWAAVSGPAERLDELAAALDDPTWPPFLGRKSCPPSAPIVPRRITAAGLAPALGQLPWLGHPGEVCPAQIRAVTEVEPGAEDDGAGLLHRRQDVPLSLVYRRFDFRMVREFFIATATLPSPVSSPRGSR